MFYINQGRYDAAINQFNQIIALAPEYDGGYNNLGMMFMYLGNNGRAGVAFEQSLAVEGESNSFALSNLGLIYFSESRFDDSVLMSNDRWRSTTRLLAVGQSGLRLRGGGDSERSEQAFRQAIELGQVQLRAEPDNTRLLCELAGYFRAGGSGGGDRGPRTGGGDDPDRSTAGGGHRRGLRRPRQSGTGFVMGRTRFDLGVSSNRFEDRPSLRGLLADERYRGMGASTVD